MIEVEYYVWQGTGLCSSSEIDVCKQPTLDQQALTALFSSLKFYVPLIVFVLWGTRIREYVPRFPSCVAGSVSG